MSTDTIIHLIAGGVGGTMGAIVTCPLEVVKTRLQSSNSGFSTPGSSSSGGGGGDSGGRAKVTPSTMPSKPASGALRNATFAPDFALVDRRGPLQITVPVANVHSRASMSNSFLQTARMSSSVAQPRRPPPSIGMVQCLKLIFNHEGVAGLFKGLGPNLMGVFPSRAIYFWAYSSAKRTINASLPKANRDTPFVHVTSAATAGFTASTLTNPIWLIKTRLQLDRASGSSSLSIRKCIQKINSELGIRGFWKGVTASYWGISETVIHFVIYENLKKRIAQMQNKRKGDDKTFIDFAGFMLCGACSKTCATIVAYPHEVARTRLREEGSVYRSFWQTLGAVYKNEGRLGLYRGLCTQLIRQIPNTAIMMSTYELTVYVLTKWLKEPELSHSSPHS